MDIWTFGYIWIHLDTFGYIWNIRWSLIAETLVPLCAISRLSSPRSTGDPGDPGDPRNRSSKSCTLSDTSTRCEDSRLAMCWNTFMMSWTGVATISLLSLMQLDPCDLRWDWTMKSTSFSETILFTVAFYPNGLQLSRYRHSIVTSVVNLFAELLTGHGSATPSGPLRVATWHSESRGLKSEVEVC